VAGQWFSLGTIVSSTNKTDDIAEILLKVASNTITLTQERHVGQGFLCSKSIDEFGDQYEIYCVL
jgi:hypothetical protein